MNKPIIFLAYNFNHFISYRKWDQRGAPFFAYFSTPFYLPFSRNKILNPMASHLPNQTIHFIYLLRFSQNLNKSLIFIYLLKSFEFFIFLFFYFSTKMSNWRRDKMFVENLMNNYDIPFEVMPKTTNNTWKQIKEDIKTKLLNEEHKILIKDNKNLIEDNKNLIEENEDLIEENENLIEENKNLMLEIERLQSEIQNCNFEKIVIIMVSIFFMFIICLKA